jgi:hypothetical protein
MIRRTKKIIYVSGKYSNGGTENETREKNIALAKKHSIDLWNMGAAVICPHTNTALFETDKRFKSTFHTLLDGDLAMLNYVDAMYLLPNWKTSAGAIIEFDYANEIKLPILLDLKEAKTFLKTKVKCPCCGLARTHYYRIYNKKYCYSCYEVIQDVMEQQLRVKQEDFLLIPKNP